MSAILVPFDLVYVVSLGCDLLSKVVPCPLPSCYGSVLLLVVVSCQVMLTLACQAVLSMGFPRQAYWSGLPFPPPSNIPDPGIDPESPALAGGF